jgi:hypothetical protein
MVRLQVQLEESQHRQVKRRAKGLGVSVAEVIRRCVDAQLEADRAEESDDRRRRLMGVAGKYRDLSGERNVSSRHDDVLVEVFRR